MQLQRLTIEKPRHGANQDKYECEVQFQSERNGSNVTMPLGDEVSRRLLAIVADELLKASKEVAASMTTDIIVAGGRTLLERGDADA